MFLGIIYMGLQSSPCKLAFEEELGRFVLYSIGVIPHLVGGPCTKVLCTRTCSLKGSGMMSPTSVSEGVLGCYIYGFAILPLQASF